MANLTHKMLKKASLAIFQILPTYTSKKHKNIGERGLNMMLWGLLEGMAGNIKREKPKVKIAGKTKSIDFKRGGAGSTVIEFAFRPAKGGQQLEAKRNRDELNKLTRVSTKIAGTRTLLLLDYNSQKEYTKKQLLAMYAKVKSTPGKYKRNPVTILYLNKFGTEYKIEWLGAK